ncbi:MAG TPA: FAD binding domain-containing protein [Bacillales bacterium]|nr:FAD binding domain-containing protein [Bacillales bacterium]
MIPFDFDYIKPATIKEAIEQFQIYAHQGKTPIFFSGGTELITLGRIDMAFADAVFDIKDIPECKVMEESEEYIVLGSALSLMKIEEANLFPFLTKTASEVADHTARGKITLGGNICAQIFYRETVLPFLLAESKVVIAGLDGMRVAPINDVFNEYLRLNNGELLVQIATERKFAKAPFFSIKRRQQWRNGYPLVTLAGLKFNDQIRIAISGLCPFPFRANAAELILNNQQISIEERVDRLIEVLPGPILDDVEGSSDYRLFVLKNLLNDVLIEGGTE